ncbi:MAG: hypothetical protein GY834_06750 [Bacteroidetes bacterium]|nr:hypothetical protein [Bacteroidota bacterium]
MNKSTINEMELLTVIVGEQPFGINIDKIQSIQQYNQELITSLPEINELIKILDKRCKK